MQNEVSVEAKLDFLVKSVSSIDGRLDKVDGRLDKIDGRLDKIDGRLDKIDSRLDKVDGRLDKVDGRLDKVDTELVAAKIRDEELHRLMKLGLEANEGLREVVDDRFARIDQKLDDESKLLRQAIKRNIPPGSGAHSAR